MTLEGSGAITTGMGQIIEEKDLPYGMYTASVLTSDNELAVANIFIDGNTKTATANFSAGNFKLLYKPNITRLTDKFVFALYAEKTFIAAKLELGAQQTLAHQDADGRWVLNDPPPNKALELANCQRYYYVMNAAKNPVAGFGQGVVNSSGKFAYIPIPIPNLRAYPAISKEGNIKLINQRTGGAVDVTSISAYRNSTGGLLAIQTAIPEGSNWAAGDPCELIANNDANARLIFDANL